MRFVWRAAVVALVFVAVWVGASHLVMRHELTKVGAPFAEVKLVSWAAGLFAGSLAALFVGIALVWKRQR